jgi:hypothetical protein
MSIMKITFDFRPITKEEKERENSKKSSPIKSLMSNRMMTAVRAEDRVDTLEKKKVSRKLPISIQRV